MLVDFQMPRMNGIQLIEKMRLRVAHLQMQYKQANIREPIYALITSFNTPMFFKLCQEKQIKHLYEKPLKQ